MANERFRLSGGGAEPLKIAANNGNINGKYGDILFSSDYAPLRVHMKGSITIDGRDGILPTGRMVPLGRVFTFQPLALGWMQLKEYDDNEDKYVGKKRGMYVRLWPSRSAQYGGQIATTTNQLWFINFSFASASIGQGLDGPIDINFRYLVFQNQTRM